MFTLPLLQAINDWQRGGDVRQKTRRGKHLKVLASDLDARFRRADLCCFRQLVLDPQHVWKLGDKLHLAETISAWTFDTEVAKVFKGGVPPGGLQGVIFMTVPTPENVIVNLAALYRDQEFLAACARARAQIVGFGDGIGRYGRSQVEVVLEIKTLPIESVYAFGGYTSSRMAIARQLFGHDPDANELENFDRLLESSGRVLGPNWITGEAKDRVAKKLLATIERLRPYHQ